MLNGNGRGANGRFVKGAPAGPGRRPVGQSLTEALRAEGERIGPDGRSNKDKLSGLVWELATTGKVTFPDRVLKADLVDWRHNAEWTYTRVDGKPPESLDVTSGGERFESLLVALRLAGEDRTAGEESDE